MFEEFDRLLCPNIDTKTKDDIIELHDGERREVSILFADIKGFTQLSEQLDHEQVRMLVDKLFQLFTLCIKQYGGYIDKYEGDLIMALFGAKITSEHDTERAIHAALQILIKLKQFNRLLIKNPITYGYKLGIRIGINTGLVTTGRIGEKREGDFTVYGDSVNVASRMESNAPVNRIMVPERTMKLVRDVFEFEDHGKIHVKGKAHPLSVFLVKGVKSKPLQRWHTYQSEYVGREQELSLLDDEYHRALQRMDTLNADALPIVIGIKGQAGLGKSRLIDEFLNNRNGKVLFLHGAPPHISQNPYSLFISIIRHYMDISSLDSQLVIKEKLAQEAQKLRNDLCDETKIDQLDDMLPIIGILLGVHSNDVRLQLTGRELQSHIQTAIRYFLEAIAAKANGQELPLLIILEDLQWLDEASRSAFQVLLNTLNLEEKRQMLPLKHVIFLLTYRPEYNVEKDIRCASEFSELELMPLATEHSEVLLHSMLKDMVFPENITLQLIQKSQGNPFYLEEWGNLIKDLPNFKYVSDIPIPNTLSSLVLSRLDRMDSNAKSVLQKAAVIGKEFFVRILAEVEKKLNNSEVVMSQLQALEMADFLHCIPDSKYTTYFFKHVITHEVAYNTLLIANRKILHHIVAEVIEEQFSGNVEEFYYDLAEHYSKTDSREKAIKYLEKAGDKAKANYENEKAIEFYDHLLVYLEDAENLAVLRIDTLLKKGEILQLIGKWEDCKHVCEKALKVSQEIGDRNRIGESYQRLALIFQFQGYHEQALSYYEDALSLFQFTKNQKAISTTLGNIGTAYLYQDEYDLAMDYYKKRLDISQKLVDQKGIAKAIGGIGIVHHSKRDHKSAIKCYEKWLAMCEKREDKQGIIAAMGNMGLLYHDTGVYTTATQYYEKALKLIEELGDKAGISRVNANIGEIYFNQGDYKAAMNCFYKDLQICKELGDRRGISIAFNNIGCVYKDEGNYTSAVKYYEQAISIAKELNLTYLLANFLIEQAEAEFLLQKFEKATVLNNEGLELAEKIRPDSVLKGKILSANIDFATGNSAKAVAELNALLMQADDKEQKADLHYELHKCGVKGENHQNEALGIYQKLYTKIPKFQWRKRILQLEK